MGVVVRLAPRRTSGARVVCTPRPYALHRLPGLGWREPCESFCTAPSPHYDPDLPSFFWVTKIPASPF